MVIEETPTGHSLKLIFGSVHKSLNYYITQKKTHSNYLPYIWSYTQNTSKWLEKSTLLLNFEWWEDRQWCYWTKVNLYTFLNDGVPTQKFLHIDPIENMYAEGIKEIILTSFSHFRISDFCSWLLSLNIDGAKLKHHGMAKSGLLFQ